MTATSIRPVRLVFPPPIGRSLDLQFKEHGQAFPPLVEELLTVHQHEHGHVPLCN